MFVDRFPFEKRTSRMVYHGVIVVWFLPVFPCLPFVSFLVFMPFLGQFLLASFPPSFLSVVPVCFFPILFFLLLHLHFVKFLLSACKYSFYPAVLFSRLVLRSGTKPKRRQKRRQNSRQAAWHELGQEQASLLPHPATTATTTIATAGPSCAFAAGICLTSTSKAPTAPASPRLLLLLMQLLLMLMLMLLVLVLVAAGSCCCDLLWLAVTAVIAVAAVAAVTAVTCCCHCCCYCYCCCYCHCYCHCSCHCYCYSSATATLAPLSLLRVTVLILAHPGTVFYNFCHCCCH